MTNVLVTGATGNIGKEVVHFLSKYSKLHIKAGVRDVGQSQRLFETEYNIAYSHFDFENKTTFKRVFVGVDILFLLRPPHITDIQQVFAPLLKEAKNAGVAKVVFLSVQGAEKSKVIPHNKIEGLIRALGFDYIFVRPSYFMQNLTTTLLAEIKNNNQITLPSGRGEFNWIDTEDIGKFIAKIISEFDQYKNQAFEVTGIENLNFYQISELLTESLGRRITFKSMNPLSFYLRKKREGMSHDFAIVMTILHFLPRVQSSPNKSANFEEIVGEQPQNLRAFIEKNKSLFLTSNCSD